MSYAQPDFSFIVRDNEYACSRALDEQNYLQAFLIVHTLIESLLRVFLQSNDESTKFSALIEAYKQFLDQQQYPEPTFMKELTKFNRRRNRIVHQLWRKGFSVVNRQAEPAARAGVVMYSLLIEWLETFDPEINIVGFGTEDTI